MASRETLEALRENLVSEITLDHCVPCPDQHDIINIADPILCGCRCERVQPLLERLSAIEHAIFISDTYLSKAPLDRTPAPLPRVVGSDCS